jgi:hypothetical protein
MGIPTLEERLRSRFEWGSIAGFVLDPGVVFQAGPGAPARPSLVSRARYTRPARDERR